jgi:hemoglobin-like flavoprotein
MDQTNQTDGLTAQQVALVWSSWRRVLPIREAAAALFYHRLFELDPSLRRLFHGDIEAQGQKLMATLGTVVVHLHRLAELLPAVEDLGRRHSAYGVTEAHYDTVGVALLGALRAGLGVGLTHEAEDAWAAAYGVLANVMKRAARRPGARVAV